MVQEQGVALKNIRFEQVLKTMYGCETMGRFMSWFAVKAVKPAGLKVIRMDMPGTFHFDPKQPGEPAMGMDAIYVNWLAGNGAVIATGFGIPHWDTSAKKTIQGFLLPPKRSIYISKS